MNWNFFWGLYILFFSIAMFLVTYLVGWKNKQKKENCNKKTIGTVIGYSAIRYNNVSLPIVEYIVNNENYTVVGPKFKASINKSFTAPWNNPITEQKTNLNSRDDLPDTIKINSKENSFIRIKTSPLKDLYPVGSKADVYYNENKPKISYVERYAEPPLLFTFYIPFILGVILLILSFYLFFGPTIIM